MAVSGTLYGTVGEQARRDVSLVMRWVLLFRQPVAGSRVSCADFGWYCAVVLDVAGVGKLESAGFRESALTVLVTTAGDGYRRCRGLFITHFGGEKPQLSLSVMIGQIPTVGRTNASRLLNRML